MPDEHDDEGTAAVRGDATLGEVNVQPSLKDGTEGPKPKQELPTKKKKVWLATDTASNLDVRLRTCISLRTCMALQHCCQHGPCTGCAEHRLC